MAEGGRTAKRTWFILGPAVGFFAAALILLASIIFLRTDRPILWPPDRAALLTAAYCVFGTAFAAALVALVWLASYVIAVLMKRRTWRDLGNALLSLLIMLALLVAAIEVSLKAFYWPWASASVVYTARSNPEKWRLPACAQIVAAGKDGTLVGNLSEGVDDLPPATQAAVNYVLAAAGDKAALAGLITVAEGLPESSPYDVSDQTPISDRADVLFLVRQLVGPDLESLQQLASESGVDLSALEWDGAARRYVSAPRENETR
ncbi:MAG: hypothetical protein ACYTAN_09825 [Planctomycetota bacterium]|jgi:hypothetical protein